MNNISGGYLYDGIVFQVHFWLDQNEDIYNYWSLIMGLLQDIS